MKEKNNESHKWIIIIAISTFLLSIFFSYISNIAMSHLNTILSILILLLVILIGIIFDLFGMAVAVANEEHFHAKASKKIGGSKTAIKLIKNSMKVSNFCADVIGDICGIISGSISAMIAFKLTANYGMNESFHFLISALVASMTVGGKAFTKELGKKHSTKIIAFVTKFINFE